MRPTAFTVMVHAGNHPTAGLARTPRWFDWILVVLYCAVWMGAMGLAVWSVGRLVGPNPWGGDRDHRPHGPAAG